MYREAQAQTEIDMEFMMQLQNQLRHQDVLEKQLYVAQTQLIEWAKAKKPEDKDKNQLSQELLPGFEIIPEKNILAGLSSVQSIQMLDMNQSQLGSKQSPLESQNASEPISELHMIKLGMDQDKAVEEEKLYTEQESHQSQSDKGTESERVDESNLEVKGKNMQLVENYKRLARPELELVIPSFPYDDNLEQDENNSSASSVSDASSVNCSDSDDVPKRNSRENQDLMTPVAGDDIHLHLRELEESKNGQMLAARALLKENKPRGRKQAA